MPQNAMTLADALAKAQGEMQNAPLNKENSYFNTKYADLAAIRDAVVPLLSANGIAVTQTPEFRGEAWVLVTTLRGHGDTIEAVYPLSIDKPQVMGSQLTYAKRYSLSSICGISADDDDDGNAAQEGDAKPKHPKQQPMAKEDKPEVMEKTKDRLREMRGHLTAYVKTEADYDEYMSADPQAKTVNWLRKKAEHDDEFKEVYGDLMKWLNEFHTALQARAAE